MKTTRIMLPMLVRGAKLFEALRMIEASKDHAHPSFTCSVEVTAEDVIMEAGALSNHAVRATAYKCKVTDNRGSRKQFERVSFEFEFDAPSTYWVCPKNVQGGTETHLPGGAETDAHVFICIFFEHVVSVIRRHA